MGSLQTQRNLNRDTGCFLYAQFSLLCDVILERDPLDQLHDNILKAPVLTDIIDIYNIRMGKLGSRLSLLLEFRYKTAVLTELRLHDFDRDETIQFSVLSFINIRHTAISDSGHDLIAFAQYNSLF